jgi:hypothetical protein
MKHPAQALTRLLIILALASLVACNWNMPQVTPTGAAATIVPPPAPTSAPSVRQPFDGKWDDRAVFLAGLVKDEQKVLDRLQGASVYHIDLQVAGDLRSLQGREQVRYTNQESKPLEAIYFQLFPTMYGGTSTISAAKVNDQDVKAVYESQDTTLRVPMPAALQPGQQVVVQLDFQVSLPREMGGNYGLFGYFNNILVLDGFYPAIPVYDGLHGRQLLSGTGDCARQSHHCRYRY